jgi:serine/threonine protein kinase
MTMSFYPLTGDQELEGLLRPEVSHTRSFIRFRLHDYFYHKEHLFIVCELLRDNLYEFCKYNRDSGKELYFTLPRLQRVARQCLEALEYLHGLELIHSDLKPENILMKSYANVDVKVIDFGSSCFVHDVLNLYVQSRSVDAMGYLRPRVTRVRAPRQVVPRAGGYPRRAL